MLEKPDIRDEHIIACLQAAYGLLVVHVTFLPLGADRNAAVYRAVAADETAYFVKLRSGVFDEIAMTLPKFLSDQGIEQIIAPIATRTEQLWTNLDAFKVILYPFVEGHNGYQVNLSDRHWGDLGAALKRIHTLVMPPTLAKRIQQETYSPQWRESVKMFLERVEDDAFDDPVAVKLAAFLKARRDEILDLVGRAERLALALQARSLEYSIPTGVGKGGVGEAPTEKPTHFPNDLGMLYVVCHSDIHAGNILIDANDALYIVDWDNPILAPKERDLMFIGGGQFGAERTPQEEETLFYQSYGQTQIDPIALAYYRYERIIQDIAAFCEQLFLTNEGGEDREQAFRYLTSNFLPGEVLEIAYKSDKTLTDG